MASDDGHRCAGPALEPGRREGRERVAGGHVAGKDGEEPSPLCWVSVSPSVSARGRFSAKELVSN